MRYLFFLLLSFVFYISCKNPTSPADSSDLLADTAVGDNEWKSLFDGKTLQGWTPKFAKSQLGVNYKNTFVVEDGSIKVKYDEYESFDNEFGHLFYQDSFSNYHLRLEYRFVGEQSPNGPQWAFKNSGVMYHCQHPSTMAVDQSFPICLEGQFLGGNGTDSRSTGNLCTPSTNVTLNGEFTTDHCINSNSKTIHDTTWVLAEFIVRGEKEAFHLIDGDTVFHFTNPLYGSENDLPDGFKDWDGKPVVGGYIALQAESHPLEFRNIEIKTLD